MKKFASGGLVPPQEEMTLVVFDRGWWKCKKCGAIYEDYTIPPIHHTCFRKEDVSSQALPDTMPDVMTKEKV